MPLRFIYADSPGKTEAEVARSAKVLFVLLALTLGVILWSPRSCFPHDTDAVEIGVNPTEIPPLAEAKSIDVMAGGWDLKVFPDGSGRVSYGSSFMDSWRLSPGSFNFAELYGALVPRLLSSHFRGSCAWVGVRGAGVLVQGHPIAFLRVRELLVRAVSRAEPGFPGNDIATMLRRCPIEPINP